MRAGVSGNYVHRLEVGNRRLPTREVIVRLAHALNVTTDELIGSTPVLPGPDPWAVALSERLDVLPEALRVRVQRLIEDFVAVVEQPLVGYMEVLQSLTGETAELDEAELQQVAEFALGLVHQQAATDADEDVDGVRAAEQ